MRCEGMELYKTKLLEDATQNYSVVLAILKMEHHSMYNYLTQYEKNMITSTLRTLWRNFEDDILLYYTILTNNHQNHRLF
jgi:hypothetical protein